jgi:hypothetical protein
VLTLFSFFLILGANAAPKHLIPDAAKVGKNSLNFQMLAKKIWKM